MRTELLRRARGAYREHGKGILVLVEGEGEPFYALREDLEKKLEGDPDARGLLEWLFVAEQMYRPMDEAILFHQWPSGIDVLVISETETWVVGSVTFLPETEFGELSG